jgi:hypothetical protein
MEMMKSIEAMFPKSKDVALKTSVDPLCKALVMAWLKISMLSKDLKPMSLKKGANFSKYWGNNWENCWNSEKKTGITRYKDRPRSPKNTR